MNGPGPATAVFDGPTTAGPGRLLNKRLSSRRACARVIVPTLGCWAVVALVLVYMHFWVETFIHDLMLSWTI